MKALPLLLFAGFAVFCALPPETQAQGPLMPPGAPAPTMKTLTQVEPRTPILAAPYTIAQAGSYYLTGNLSGKVTVAADDVSLDLMGFTITGASGGAIGQSASVRNLWIHDGGISAPEGSGINLGGSASTANGRIENVRVSNCLNGGIIVGDGFLVEGCQIFGTGLAGIRVNGNSVVRRCTIEGCGVGLYLTGAGALVEGNIVRGNTDNYDFAAGNCLNLLLCEIPETLAWPCCVRLAGTLVMTKAGTGIQVSSDNVTIDLDGHALVGAGTLSAYGINQSASFKNLTVMNGSIVNWVASNYGGVFAAGSANSFSGLHVATNYLGMRVGPGSTVENCVVIKNVDNGIFASAGSSVFNCVTRLNAGGIVSEGNCVVSGCTANYNRGTGIQTGDGCAVSKCAAYGNKMFGFYVDNGSTISDSTAYANESNGYYVSSCCVISRCSAQENLGDGFWLSGGSVIKDCFAQLNAQSGIHVSNNAKITACRSENQVFAAGFFVTGSGNHIEGCSATDNSRGFDIDAGRNFIVRNTASWNTVNWDVAAGNVCLVVSAATCSAFSGSSGGTAPGSTDPNANFSH